MQKAIVKRHSTRNHGIIINKQMEKWNSYIKSLLCENRMRIKTN